VKVQVEEMHVYNQSVFPILFGDYTNQRNNSLLKWEKLLKGLLPEQASNLTIHIHCLRLRQAVVVYSM
jgi:hypothetical protein